MMALSTPFLADSWGWHHGDVGIGWMIAMMLGMFVFWGAVIAVVVWALRGRGWATSTETPEDVLRRRLAEGAITVEEYEARHAALNDEVSTTATPPGAPA